VEEGEERVNENTKHGPDKLNETCQCSGVKTERANSTFNSYGAAGHGENSVRRRNTH